MACFCPLGSSTKQEPENEKTIPTSTIINLTLTLVSIILFFADVSTDLMLTFFYLNQSHYIWFGLTLAFVLVPSISNSILSLYLYYNDYKKMQKKQNSGTSSTLWIFRVVFTILQMAPVVRYVEVIRYGIQSITEQTPAMCDYYNEWMLRESVDARMLGLFESFMESAPQLTLQLYILVVDPTQTLSPLKIVTLLTSWITIGLSLTSYQRALRSSLKNKKEVKIGASVVYFLWRVFEAGPRILIISMFMSEYRYWVVVPLSLHWILVFIWFQRQELKFFESTIGQTAFNVMCAFITIFCSFDPQDGKSRYRYMLFYALFYGENIMMFLLWFCFTSHMGTWYRMVMLYIVLCGAILHAIFFGCFYGCCHPERSPLVDWHKIFPSSCCQIPKAPNDENQSGNTSFASNNRNESESRNQTEELEMQNLTSQATSP